MRPSLLDACHIFHAAMEDGRTDSMAGQEVFAEVGTEGGGNVKVDLKEEATLSASGVKEPESRPSLPPGVCDSGPSSGLALASTFAA